MYEDSWYSFVPDSPAKKDDSVVPKLHNRRRESLLKQSNDTDHVGLGQRELYNPLLEESFKPNGPPQATLARRAKSYSDFYHVVRAQFTDSFKSTRDKERVTHYIPGKVISSSAFDVKYEAYDDCLLDASHEEFQLYRDQLALSERHLDSLLDDTSSALAVLASLSSSFKAVGSQTTAFQAQCEDVLADQRRLKTLSDEVGTDLQYYGYLEPITRRLNAPGASRMLGDDSLVEMLTSLNACIEFMISHPEHRESETYLTRYKSLLARTLNLVQIKFSQIIKESTADAQKRIAEGKLTMTTIYLVQAPGTALTARQLERAMEWIIRMAKLAFDESEKPEIQRGHSGYRDHLETYHGLFKNLMEMYIESRRQIIPGVIQIMLNKSRTYQKASQEVFSSYAHECLDMVLEISSNEHSKYAMMFLGRAGLVKYAEKNAFYHFWVDQGMFYTFLQDLCGLAVVALETDVRNADIPSGIDLILWLDAHYEYAMSDESDNGLEREQDDGHVKGGAVASDVQIKARLANEIKAKITSGIFSRMREILLKNVENYVAKPEDIIPQKATLGKAVEVVGENGEPPPTETDVQLRAEKALGPGLSNSYPALKTAVQLLIFYNDLTFDLKGVVGPDKGELAYEIMHSACSAIMRGASAVTTKYNTIDGNIFAIKNLVLLKNLVLAYEISGSRQASALDFSRMWATFSELRNRGGLFDVTAYYALLRSGNLFPQVVMSVQDARTELDGLLRETIIQFRERCASVLWNERARGPAKDAWKTREALQARLNVMFSHEQQLRDNLWAAVEETVEEKKKKA